MAWSFLQRYRTCYSICRLYRQENILGGILMRKSKEELMRLHKEKCRELKKIRAQIAEELGVDLKQSECTYEGYCSGTCPKCKSEEMKLNLAIMKRQMETADVKRKVATAGITTAAALSLSGCNLVNVGMEGGLVPAQTIDALEGDVAVDGGIEYTDEAELSTDWALGGEVEPPTEESTEEGAEGRLDVSGPEIEGKLVVPESEEWELAGDIAILEESTGENTNE